MFFDLALSHHQAKYAVHVKVFIGSNALVLN
jgi:hypothetical protein